MSTLTAILRWFFWSLIEKGVSALVSMYRWWSLIQADRKELKILKAKLKIQEDNVQSEIEQLDKKDPYYEQKIEALKKKKDALYDAVVNP